MTDLRQKTKENIVFPTKKKAPLLIAPQNKMFLGLSHSKKTFKKIIQS